MSCERIQSWDEKINQIPKKDHIIELTFEIGTKIDLFREPIDPLCFKPVNYMWKKTIRIYVISDGTDMFEVILEAKGKLLREYSSFEGAGQDVYAKCIEKNIICRVDGNETMVNKLRGEGRLYE